MIVVIIILGQILGDVVVVGIELAGHGNGRIGSSDTGTHHSSVVQMPPVRIRLCS